MLFLAWAPITGFNATRGVRATAAEPITLKNGVARVAAGQYKAPLSRDVRPLNAAFWLAGIAKLADAIARVVTRRK